MGKPGFNFLPYGVRTPDSIMSTGSRFIYGSGGGSLSGYGAGWKLPDKLRIVKPLEGSLTLHNWQRLAVPHLGNILEERSGIVVKGRKLSPPDNFALSDLENQPLETLEEHLVITLQADDTKTFQTFTDSTVLHPDDKLPPTLMTSSYNQMQMSSGFGDLSRASSTLPPSRPDSRLSNMSSSYSDVHQPSWRRDGALTVSSNIGLARVLNERHIHGYLSSSTMSLNNQSSIGDEDSICNLTPSVISSPTGFKSFSPTGTPLNSPIHTPPGTPPDEQQESSGLVYGFFSSLRSALYGEQQKEAQTIRQRKKKGVISQRMKKLGILEKVEEVGVENLLCPSPNPSCNSMDRCSRSPSFVTREKSEERNDLEQDLPSVGGLTITSNAKQMELVSKSGDPATVGQLSASSRNLEDLGHVMGGRGPGRTMSGGAKRPQLLGAFGVPGTPGTGALRLQPPSDDAGLRVRPDLGSVPQLTSPQTNESTTGFIGSITSMFFGRKGGLL